MSKTVRIDLDVRRAIAARALEGETPNTTLRRLLGLEPDPQARRTPARARRSW
jgi:hypothetical protein